MVSEDSKISAGLPVKLIFKRVSKDPATQAPVGTYVNSRVGPSSPGVLAGRAEPPHPLPAVAIRRGAGPGRRAGTRAPSATSLSKEKNPITCCKENRYILNCPPPPRPVVSG